MKITLSCKDGATYEGGPIDLEDTAIIANFIYRYLRNNEVPPLLNITIHIY